MIQRYCEDIARIKSLLYRSYQSHNGVLVSKVLVSRDSDSVYDWTGQVADGDLDTGLWVVGQPAVLVVGCSGMCNSCGDWG